MTNYPKGTIMRWKISKIPAYQKIDNDEFGSWRGLDNPYKPLDQNHGWKWTDEMVEQYYKGIMDIIVPKILPFEIIVITTVLLLTILITSYV
jgi:hypothetical protein